MLLVNNNRSKAYLQNLIKNGFIPSKIIVLDNKNHTLVEHTENDKIISKDTEQKFIRSLNDLNISFDEKEHIQKTIVKNNLDFSVVDTLDVNSLTVINAVKELTDEYIVYSGPGGTILRKEILSLNKKFIHVHPGLLPGFRGSTTIYYSMLLESTVGCSVILFDEKIGGTVHMAIGQSYIQAGGKNESTIHWDMIADMVNGGEIYADDEKIYESGGFLFV